jgi:hypothetical protein
MIRLLCCITFWLLTNGSLAQDDRIPAEARVVTSESLATDYSEHLGAADRLAPRSVECTRSFRTLDRPGTGEANARLAGLHYDIVHLPSYFHPIAPPSTVPSIRETANTAVRAPS